MTAETWKRGGLMEELRTLSGVERVDENVSGFVITYTKDAKPVDITEVQTLLESRGYAKSI